MRAEQFHFAIAQHPHQCPVHLHDRAMAVDQQPVERGIGQTPGPLPPGLLAIANPAAPYGYRADTNPERGGGRDKDKLQPVNIC